MNKEMNSSDYEATPWAKFPEFPMHSMGWRMGIGEQYLISWRRCYYMKSDKERAAYRNAWPEPKEWSGFYEKLEIGVAYLFNVILFAELFIIRLSEI